MYLDQPLGTGTGSTGSLVVKNIRGFVAVTASRYDFQVLFSSVDPCGVHVGGLEHGFLMGYHSVF